MDPWSTFLPHLLPSSPLRSHQCGICKVENAGIPDPGFTGLSGTSSPCDILPPNPGHTQAPRRQKKTLQPLPRWEKLEMLCGPELGEVPVLEMQHWHSTSASPGRARGVPSALDATVPLPGQLRLSQAGHRWGSVPGCALCSPLQLLLQFPSLWKRQKDTAQPRCSHPGLGKGALPGPDIRLGCP